MDTERYCHTMGKLDRVKAIRAIHQSYLQLKALSERVYDEATGTDFDNRPAIQKLEECLKDAGHIGF